MNTITENPPAGLSSFNESIRTYASRLARLLLLKRLCSEDHPVLMNEIDLVEMAKSKLQEQYLCHSGRNKSSVRMTTEESIRKIATSRVISADEDDDVKESIIHQINAMDFSHLFPILN